MELHLCPGCEAFVRREWTACRACGQNLSTDDFPAIVKSSVASEPQESSWEAPGSTSASSRYDLKPPTEHTEYVVAAPAEHQEAPTPETPSDASDLPSPPSFRELQSPSALIGTRNLDSNMPTAIVFIAIGLGVIVVLVLVVSVLFGARAIEKQNARDLLTNASPSSTTTTTLPPQDRWQTFTSPDGTFSVDLPSLPAVEYSQREGRNVTSYRAITPDGTQVVVEATDLPAGKDYARNDQALNSVTAATAKANSTAVLTSVLSTNNNRRQVDARLSDTRRFVDLRCFAVGTTAYTFTVSSTDPNGDPRAFSRITESFKAN